MPRSEPNASGNVSIEGDYAAPLSPDEVEALLRQADSRTIRMLARRYSTSPLLCTADAGALVMDLRNVAWPTTPGASRRVRMLTEVPDSRFESSVDRGAFVELTAGASIDEVNQFLELRGRSLEMMGAFSNQTFIGAMSTSTHGSGAGFGCLCDLVVSMELVTRLNSGAVQRLRLERPSQRLTSAASGETVVLDDALFDAVLVSGGFFGAVVSVIARTVEAFDLETVRVIENWSTTAARFDRCDSHFVPTDFASAHTFGITLTPFRDKGNERSRSAVSISRRVPADPSQRTPLPQTDIAALFNNLGPMLVVSVGQPSVLINGIGNTIEEVQAPGRLRAVSHKLMTSPNGFPLAGIGVEYAFPLDAENTGMRALKQLLRFVDAQAQSGTAVMAGFFTVRIIPPSRAFLAMSNDPVHQRHWLTVEVLMTTQFGCKGALVDGLESIAIDFKGRPHWGQVFALNAGHGAPVEQRLKLLKPLYGSVDAWVAAWKQLDVSPQFLNAVGKALTS